MCEGVRSIRSFSSLNNTDGFLSNADGGRADTQAGLAISGGGSSPAGGRAGFTERTVHALERDSTIAMHLQGWS